MKRAVIFGATDTGENLYEDIKGEYNVIGFTDGNPALYGKNCKGYKVCSLDEVKALEWDFIIVAVISQSRRIKELLLSNGIEEWRIIDKYVEFPRIARLNFLKNMAGILVEEDDGAAIAELGVFQGEFAEEMGKCFSDRRFYLFDTFEGLPQEDIEKEKEKGYSTAETGRFANTAVNDVLKRIDNKERCIVCKGYFPDTAAGIEDKFCFVNLDADLYEPTIQGLRYFYPRLVNGGVILIHDYYSVAFRGVREAVKEFAATQAITFMPIGDTLSVAIRKWET